MPTYKSYMNSGNWRRKRSLKLEQAGHRCEACGRRQAKGLHVHHLTYARLGNERLADLAVLCKDCHFEAHSADAAPKRRKPRPRYVVTKGRTDGFYLVVDRKHETVVTKFRARSLACEFAAGANAVSGPMPRRPKAPSVPRARKRAPVRLKGVKTYRVGSPEDAAWREKAA